MPPRKDSKQIVSRNEHGETRPAHRIAGGTRFDGQEEAPGHRYRGSNAKGPAPARKGAKKKQADNLNHALEEIMDEEGNIRYDDH